MFKELSITLDSVSAERLSDIFLELGTLSVTIEDQHAGTDLEQPIFGEPGEVETLWQQSLIKVLLDDKTDVPQLIKDAETRLDQILTYNVVEVQDQDWVRLTQSQFDPIKITDKLYIVPSWHQSPSSSATTITLDPGLAFGTGSHPTTFMCLKWISQNITYRDTLLDYGCGSGILAIAAKRLGASLVCGTDIDDQALESSNANALQNATDIKFYPPDKLPQQQFDIVVANILANPLRILAPVFAGLTKNTLILSGILETQASELINIYKQHFAQVEIADSLDGWVMLKATTVL